MPGRQDPETGNTFTELIRRFKSFNLSPASPITASGYSNVIEVGDLTELIAYLNVTVVGGTTPSLTVQIETSPDGTDWYSMATAFAAVTTVNRLAALKVTNVGRYIRARFVVSGTTPSFTFTLKIAGKS